MSHEQIEGGAGAFAGSEPVEPLHYVYQRIHTLAGRGLHLADHLAIASRAFQVIYGVGRPEFEVGLVAAAIADNLRLHRSPHRASAVVMVRLVPDDDGEPRAVIEYERPLFEVGYTHSCLRPCTATFEYPIPFEGLPTGFSLSAAALFDTLALLHHSSTRSVRRRGGELLSCGDAVLFGLRGHTLFTAPLSGGGIESVERRLVMAAARGARLEVLEEAMPYGEMAAFDELFFADAAGITSISECDGVKFMSLVAARLAAGMSAGDDLLDSQCV